MNVILRFFRYCTTGLWRLLTFGLKTLWAWTQEAFVHMVAGGAVTGTTKLLGLAREQAERVGARGAPAPAMSYTGGRTLSGSSSSSSSPSKSAATRDFMGQFV